MASRVLHPLALADTSFGGADPERLTTAYAPTPEGHVESDLEVAYLARPAFDDGAAGLVSSADDLYRFGLAHLRNGAGGDEFLAAGSWGLGLAVNSTGQVR
jgi:CubicO group peptidase (beta-lactamase class C family)